MVLFKQERIGKSVGSNDKDIVDFYNFMEEMKLNDLPCVGGRLTWFSGNVCAMSRLDRFFITDNLIFGWKVEYQVEGKRVSSDHCLVWMKSSDCDWGPK